MFAKIEDERMMVAARPGTPEATGLFQIVNLEERNDPAKAQAVKDRVDKLYDRVRSRYPELFSKQAETIDLPPRIIVYLVSQLGHYDFLNSSVDVKGEAYETIVGKNLEGTRGEFFTPRNAVKMGIKLKIAGRPAGYYSEYKKLKKLSDKGVEFLGYVDDNEMAKLYASAKAFLALSEDEDFGITPVESMLAGTPVIAFRGGGYLESVVEGKTGIFFDESTVESLSKAIKQFNKLHIKPSDCITQAKKFSKERFKREMLQFVNSHVQT